MIGYAFLIYYTFEKFGRAVSLLVARRKIAIYVTRLRKRAFYNPLTERRKFSTSSREKYFADRDSEGTMSRNRLTSNFDYSKYKNFKLI